MEIRPYRLGDEEGFQVLDRLVEIHPWNRRNLDNWWWKYKGPNPAGDALIFVAEHNGEMIAHFAAIPMWYWVDGDRIRGSHSIAMMVKPEWQNRGLIKFVADKLIQELEAYQIPFTYGYPNCNAHELHTHMLGYEDIAMQELLEYKIPTSGPAMSDEALNGWSFRAIERFAADVDRLWEKSRGSYRALVVRTADFLNWRYIDRPDIPYYVFGAYHEQHLMGYCVLKLYREAETLRGHFLDLFAPVEDSSTARFLIEHGIRFFQNRGATEVNLWMQGAPTVRRILSEFGFRLVSSRPLVCRFNTNGQELRPILTEKNWYFTMGDTLEIY